MISHVVTLDAQTIVRRYPALAREITRLMTPPPARGGVTKRQQDLLVFLRRYIGEHGYSPSFDEIKDELGLASKSGVHRLVNGLKDRGFIRVLHGQSRSIRLRESE